MHKNKNKKAVVILSGGLDSTALVYGLIKEGYKTENVSAISFNYGQKHTKELALASLTAEQMGLKEHKIFLFDTTVFQGSSSTLLQGNEDVSSQSYAERLAEGGGVVDTYVPNRNAIMINIASAYAMSQFPDEEVVEVFYGAHLDDAAGNAYPDCSPEFVDAAKQSIWEGTNRVRLRAPFVEKEYTKADIVRYGLDAQTPFENTWSCYRGGEKACGRCGTCIDRLNAFDENGWEDPIEYE